MNLTLEYPHTFIVACIYFLGIMHDITVVSHGKGQDLFLCSFHESLQIIKEKKEQVPPIPHIEFFIPKEFHEVEYKVYLYSMLPKMIPQLH